MTVIVWDGITLAADKMAVVQGHKYPVVKVHRLDAANLVGVSGHLGRATAALAWLRHGGKPDEFPKSVDADDYMTMMVVNADREVWVYENSPYPFRVDRPTHAIGAGRDYAITALELGKAAAECVALASAHSSSCGLGCDALTFEEAA